MVLDDGSAFCWGANDIGQLGDGGYNAQHGGYNSPSTGNGSPDDYGLVQVPTGNHVLKIVCGNRFTCAILDDHSVVCFGNGANGRLGNGGVGNACKDWNDGTCGDGLVRVNLGFARGAVDVAVGYDWACAVLDDGGVLCWGNNVGDTLGYESAAHGDVGDALLEPGGAVDPIVFAGGKAVKIYGMSKSRCVILDNGDIACWGDSTNGQLGVGTDGSLSALREHTGTCLGFPKSRHLRLPPLLDRSSYEKYEHLERLTLLFHNHRLPKRGPRRAQSVCHGAGRRRQKHAPVRDVARRGLRDVRG